MRSHAIVALLVVAALITPTGDPFTLFIVFIPIYTLWAPPIQAAPFRQLCRELSLLPRGREARYGEEIGRRAGAMLLATVAIAYLMTFGSGALAYVTANFAFPSLIVSDAYIAATHAGEKPDTGKRMFHGNLLSEAGTRRAEASHKV